MVRYFSRRLIYFVMCLFAISLIMFGIFKSVPGDPARFMMEGSQSQMTPEAYERMYQQARQKLGLDEPIYTQYFKWMGNLLTGDFGYSIYYRAPVRNVVASPLRNTLLMNLLNLLLVFPIAVFLGINAAIKRGTIFDNIIQVVTVIGYTLPNFLIAILAILFFAVNLKLFPINGMYTPDFQGTTWEFIKDRAYYMTLPLMVMVFASLGGLTRQTRTAMLEALSMDSVRTARAKGLREKVVIYSHAFRNALIPLITVMMAWFIGIFGGSVAIERTFNWNGMGKIMIESLVNQDYTTAMTINMFYAFMALTGNLLMDIAYTLADPRVKFE